MATIGPDPAIPYRAALKEFGRNPADYSIAQLRMVYVAKSSGQAWDDTQEHIHYMMQHYAKWLGGEAKDAPGDENVWDLSEARELRNSKYAEGLRDRNARGVRAESWRGFARSILARTSSSRVISRGWIPKNQPNPSSFSPGRSCRTSVRRNPTCAFSVGH